MPSIVRRIGNLGEWEDIITRYGNDIMRLAYFYLKDRALAEDIMQDAFLRAYQKIGAFRGDCNMKTWLLRITANLCKDHLRSWFWQRTRVTGENYRATAGNSRGDPYTEAVIKEQHRTLVTAVLSLPLKYREVVVLFYYHGLTSKEIAQTLDTNESTIRSRLSRAREQLKKNL